MQPFKNIFFLFYSSKLEVVKGPHIVHIFKCCSFPSLTQVELPGIILLIKKTTK